MPSGKMHRERRNLDPKSDNETNDLHVPKQCATAKTLHRKMKLKPNNKDVWAQQRSREAAHTHDSARGSPQAQALLRHPRSREPWRTLRAYG